VNDGYIWWALLLGIAIGVALGWVLIGRSPRVSLDLDGDHAFPTPPAWPGATPSDLSERGQEAAWISRTIEEAGGIAPEALVEEVLDLHDAWVARARPPGVSPRSSPARDAGPPGASPPGGAPRGR
jgi:hypothetical protein